MLEEFNFGIIQDSEHEEQSYDDLQEIPPPMPVLNSKGKGVANIKAPTMIGNYFMPMTTPGAQTTLKSVLQSKYVVQMCHIAISKWMIDACIPFDVVNSVYYQLMLDAVASMGIGFKVPNFHDLRGFLLTKHVEEVKKYINGYRPMWKNTGCTNGGWMDESK